MRPRLCTLAAITLAAALLLAAPGVRAQHEHPQPSQPDAMKGMEDMPGMHEMHAHTDRTTVSAIYARPLTDGNWQTTFAWGRNHRSPGTTTDGYLLESAATCGRSTLFGRAEKLGNDELFGHSFEETGDTRPGKVFTVGKFSLGYL